MRRFLDDGLDDHPADEDKSTASWAVALTDDCEGCDDLRVVLSVEEAGGHGRGVAAHLSADSARRLRLALASALKEIGADPG